jgi:hypothetical protein
VSHDIETVTDRLLRRRYGFPYPRNSLGWAGTQLAVAFQQIWHALRPELWKLAGLLGRTGARLRSLGGSR